MNIYLTESEYDAISFAWSQIATEIEASSDDSFTIEAGEAISQLSSNTRQIQRSKKKKRNILCSKSKVQRTLSRS